MKLHRQLLAERQDPVHNVQAPPILPETKERQKYRKKPHESMLQNGYSSVNELFERVPSVEFLQ